MVLSADEITKEAEEFADLARAMKELTTSTAGQEHKSTIIGFAAQSAGYSGKIKKAKTPEDAEKIIKEASGKRDKWLQLLELLCVAAEMEDPDSEALKEAENKLRATAEQLRKVSSTGETDVFKKIGDIATQAEEGLQAFLDAPTPQEKWNQFGKVEEARAGWVLQMANVKEEVDARPPLEDPMKFLEAAQAAAAARDTKRASCDYVDETTVAALQAATECMSVKFDKASCEGVSETPSGIMDFTVPDAVRASYSKSSVAAAKEEAVTNASSAAASSAPKGPGVKLPPLSTPEEIRAALLKFVDAMMEKVKGSVDTILADDRFEGCHDDSRDMLVEAEKAVVVFTQDFAGDDNAKQVAFRVAILASSNAKKGCFNLQKYDIYQVKGNMPKLAKTHKDVCDCSKAVVDIMDFTKSEAQKQDMKTDKVTTFLKENWGTFVNDSAVAAKPASKKQASPAEDEGVLV